MWDKFKFKVGDLESLERQFIDGLICPILNECILDDSHIYSFNFFHFWCCLLVGSIHGWSAIKEWPIFKILPMTNLIFLLFKIIIVVLNCCMPIDKMTFLLNH
jgi:hypothetical protein